MVNLSNLNTFLKNLSGGFKIFLLYVKVDKNVYKTANKSASIHTIQMIFHTFS